MGDPVKLSDSNRRSLGAVAGGTEILSNYTLGILIALDLVELRGGQPVVTDAGRRVLEGER